MGWLDNFDRGRAMIRLIDIDPEIKHVIDALETIPKRACGHLGCSIQGRSLADIFAGNIEILALIDYLTYEIGCGHGLVLALQEGIKAKGLATMMRVHDFGRSAKTSKVSIVLSYTRDVC